MKLNTTRTLSGIIATAVLMNFSIASAAMLKAENVRDKMNAEVKISKEADIRAKSGRTEEILTQLGRASNGLKSTTLNAGLSKVLTTTINGGEVQVKMIEVADSIARAHEILKDNTIIGNDLDAGAAKLKTNMEAAVQAYAQGIGLVAGKIRNANSTEAKAVAKILVMGREIVRGKLSADETQSYTELMQLMVQSIQSGAAKTAEEALSIALKQYDNKIDVAKKVDELLGCRI